MWTKTRRPNTGEGLAGQKTRHYILLIAAGLLVPNVEAGRVHAPKGYTLEWSDEFKGKNGSLPDAKKWTYDIGGSGWGNHELEYYTNRPENARIEHGKLVITARAETYTGPDGKNFSYTSARLKTQGLFSQAYGRFEARIKLPAGQGIWPAFWMLGDNIAVDGWPKCGEIDIMENILVERFSSLCSGVGTGSRALLSRFESIRHVYQRAMASGRRLGVRPSVFYYFECGRRRRLAGRAGCHDRVPADHAGRLRPRLQTQRVIATER